MPLELVETGIHLSVIDCTRAFPDRLEKQGLRIEFGINAKNVKDNSGRWLFIAAANDQSVADDKKEFPLVVIVESRKRVNGTPQGIFAFRVARNLTDDKFVQHLGVPLRGKLQRSEDCQNSD